MATKVILHTNMGDVSLKMYDDMPITVGNFVKLAKKGFYDGTIFHRVIKDFMVQGGDPTGTGTGGPGYTIADEYVKGHTNARGTIAMANTGRPHSGGSQFFINTVDNGYLDWDNPMTPSKHPVFGEVVSGMEVMDKISKLPTNRMDKPKDDVVIEKAEVIEEWPMTYAGPKRNVFEALGYARIVVEDGRVVSIEDRRLSYCPLFKRYRNLGALDKESIRENVEFRMKDFGFCTDDRITRASDTISFGTSETLSLALADGKLDLVCFVADGCGSAMTSDPEILQGMCGRISGVLETYPVKRVIADIGENNVLDPDTADIDPISMAKIAAERCDGLFAVTIGGPGQADDAEKLRETHGDRVLIYGCHTSLLSRCDAERVMRTCDIVTACANGHLREIAEADPTILIAGNKIPMYAVTHIGKEILTDKLRSIGKEPWRGQPPREDPAPLL